MKKVIYIIVLCLLAFSLLHATDFPAKPSGPVADYATVISANDERSITALAQALWEQAGFALIVATIPDIGDEQIDDYANRLYEHWGIGAKGKDEGVLVLLSLKPRKVRIEAGYGAEGYLNDAKCGRILDEYGLPYFRANQFSSGLVSVSNIIARVVAHEKNITLMAPVQRRRVPRRQVHGQFSVLQLIFFIIIAALLLSTRFGRAILFGMLLSSLLGGGRRGFGGGGFGGGFGGGGFGGGFGGGLSGGGGASRGF